MEQNKKLIEQLVVSRVNSLRGKRLHTTVQMLTNLIREEHSCSSYLITILFPKKTAKESWKDVPAVVEQLKEIFSEWALCYAVIGVEIHRSMHKRAT